MHLYEHVTIGKKISEFLTYRKATSSPRQITQQINKRTGKINSLSRLQNSYTQKH